MSLNHDIHVGDVGTRFRVTIKDIDPDTGIEVVVDISLATTKEVRFRAPSGARKDCPATFLTDGTDGILEYHTVQGDMDEAGRWSYQAFLDLVAWQGHSALDFFQVERNLTP